VYALAGLPFLTRLAEHPETLSAPRAFLFSAFLLLLGAVALIAILWQGPGTAGLRRPAGWRWLLAFPVALAAGLLGGSWLPATGAGVGTALLLALAAELLFRGAVLGAFLGQIAGHRRTPLLSPTVLSTALYAPFTALGLVPLAVPDVVAEPPLLRYAVVLVTATLFGLATGWARERSESLLAPVLFHLVTIAVALLLL
jgi:membrane protease YdiL (CAAX protease family)